MGCCPGARLSPLLLLQVPVFDWRVLPAAVRRIDLGGKALTNFMKELVSYRWGPARPVGRFSWMVRLGALCQVAPGSRCSRIVGCGDRGPHASSASQEEQVFGDQQIC